MWQSLVEMILISGSYFDHVTVTLHISELPLRVGRKRSCINSYCIYSVH